MQFLVCVCASDFFIFFDTLPTGSHYIFRHMEVADMARLMSARRLSQEEAVKPTMRTSDVQSAPLPSANW